MPNRINVDIPHTSLKLIYSKYMTKKPKVNVNFKLSQITYKNDNQTDSAARTTETGKFFFFFLSWEKIVIILEYSEKWLFLFGWGQN